MSDLMMVDWLIYNFYPDRSNLLFEYYSFFIKTETL